MKVFFRRIHLYLALIAGLVITVTCLTGAVLVFEEELQHGLHHQRYFGREGTQWLPLESLINAAQKAAPGTRVTAIKLYTDRRRTAELSLADKKANEGKKPGKGGGEGGKKAFVNRYTGEVVEVYEYRKSGFYTVMALHRWMLGGEIGKLIVGTCTLIFLFIIITGIILWWPKNKAILRQRLKMKWNSGWKRLNHDYHIVLGFYSAIFLFIFAFTGLAWSFEWFNNGIYTLTGTSSKSPKPPFSALPAANSSFRFTPDAALAAAQQLVPGAHWYNVSLPKGDSAALTVNLLPADAPHESASTACHFDQYSGKLLQRVRFEDRNAGQRVRATFKPVHTGSIWGWPSKVIALITCLLGGFFPISGYIMWVNRTWKRRRKAALL